jgi:two-component system nitrate/nitrite sensor histidine kinase NarX
MLDTSPVGQDTRSFVGAIVDETALALEGVRLRQRELVALHQMQSLRQKTDLQASLANLLDNFHQTLDADFSILVIIKHSGQDARVELTNGDLSEEMRPFINGVLESVIVSAQPVHLGDVSGASAARTGFRSLIGVPLLGIEGATIGAILVASRRQQALGQRQIAILKTMASQVVYVHQNSIVVMDIEYQAMMKERRRLAREIHDGLAQTLGFLKLQAAQMRNYLGRGEYERARVALDQYYQALSEAYQDARQAIDGLRIGVGENGVQGWLDQLVADFQETAGLPVTQRHSETAYDLPQEVHAQLIRIVQEAFSNIRKHANASHVWVNCVLEDGQVLFEIQDDGDGFAPEDISGPSRHGLRGMRERADLIGADLQVVSRPSEGTIIRIHLPMSSLRVREDVG